MTRDSQPTQRRPRAVALALPLGTACQSCVPKIQLPGDQGKAQPPVSLGTEQLGGALACEGEEGTPPTVGCPQSLSTQIMLIQEAVFKITGTAEEWSANLGPSPRPGVCVTPHRATQIEAPHALDTLLGSGTPGQANL